VIGLAAQLAELTQSSAIARLLEDACHVVVVLSGAVWLSPPLTKISSTRDSPACRLR
jgi:hypothetical protein